MSDLWQNITTWTSAFLGISPRILIRLIETLLLFIMLFVARRVVYGLVERGVEDAHKKYVYRKSAKYVFGIIVVLGLILIWLGGLAGLATYLGVLSAGFAIALQDPLVNLAGWLFITVRHPFNVGDRVQIGEHAGDVIEVRLFQFTIVEIGNWVDADQSTGRLIHIPNGWVFKRSTTNYTQAFKYIWNELPITITFESNWKKAKTLLTEIAQRHAEINTPEEEEQVRQEAEEFNLVFHHLQPIVWTSVADVGVTLTIRYLCPPRRRRSSETKLWEDVLDAFAKADDIDFAYPTTRFYDNRHEGKTEARSNV